MTSSAGGASTSSRTTQAATPNRIAVMEAGRIIEVGTHEQLATAGGPYSRLWAAWTGARLQCARPE